MNEELEKAEHAHREQLMRIAQLPDGSVKEEIQEPYEIQNDQSDQISSKHHLESTLHGADPEPLLAHQPEQHPGNIPLTDPESHLLSPQGNP